MLNTLSKLGITVGLRVRLIAAAERFPHFVIEAGATGTIESVAADLLSVRMDETVLGAEAWNNCLQWALSNGGPDDLAGFLATVQRMDDTSWGPPAAELESEAFRFALARRFSTLLHGSMDEREMRAVVAANAEETDPLVCHSHDVVDANVMMAEAWMALTGTPALPSSDLHAQTLNAAWSLARKAAFCAPALIPGARYLGVWGAAEFVGDAESEHDGDFFCWDNGYGADDMAAIADLPVGATWQCNQYVTHRVTRVA